MSTHAVIVEQVPDGYRGIYVHFDGYIVNTSSNGCGKNLQEHFNHPLDVDSLINLSFASSVCKSLPLTKKGNKERETRKCLKHIEPHIHHGYTVEDVTNYFIDKYNGNDGNIDYIYIFSKDTTKWYVDIPYRDMYNVSLGDIIANEELCETLNTERMGK